VALRSTLAVIATLVITMPAVASAAGQAGAASVTSNPPTAFAVSQTAAAPQTPAATRSTETTMTCTACHGEGTPTADVPADICFRCHGANGPGPVVYGGDSAAYFNGAPHKGHTASHGDSGYRGCISCHDVHGKAVIPGSKMLRDDPAEGVVSDTPVAAGGESGFGAFTQPVTNQPDFCLDCHAGAYRYTSAGKAVETRAAYQSVFPRCAGCHATGDVFCTDSDSQTGGFSHVMTTRFSKGADQKAWKASALDKDGPTADTNSCTICHDAKGFPHTSNGDELISDYRLSDDGFCARCHTDSGNFSTAAQGVGVTY
jgi:predicted CXXCH cytochrome family protein